MSINTTVKEVQIYRKGAIVQRTGTVDLKPGTNTVQIHGITNGTDPDTIRFFFPEGVVGNNIRTVDPASEKDRDDRPSAKTAERITSLQQEIDTLKEQITLWKENGHFAKATAVNITDMENYIDRLPERLRTIRSRIREQEKEKKELEKTLSDQMEEENRPYISLDLVSEKEGNCPFRIQYFEKDAFWRPVYEIHTEGAGSDIEIRVRAKIVENTQEDWENVKVTLFTGNPSVTSWLPRLEPIYVSFRPEYIGARASAPLMADAAVGGFAGSMSKTMSPMYEDSEETAALDILATNEAEVSSSETMTEYALNKERTIIKGTEGTTADLNQFTLKAEYRLTAVPKLSNNAYLTAEVKTADLPVTVGGTASVYMKGMFAGNITIDPDMSEDTFLISFGKDEKVSVMRKELKRKKSLNMLKTQQIRDHEYEITVTSLKDETVNIRILDQLPISRDKSITIEHSDLAKAVLNETTGELKWDCELKPKQTEVIKYAYKITWPKDKNIRETAY